MGIELKLRKLAGRAIENAEIKNGGTNAGALFRPIADLLMNECVLIAKTGEFRIAEIEFYLMTGRHNDETTHTSPRQRQFGVWYVHRFRNSDKFATYQDRMGIDIAIGGSGNPFGILIRALELIGGVRTKSGPVHTLKALYPEEYKYDIRGDKEPFRRYSAAIERTGIFDAYGCLYLAPREMPRRKIIADRRTLTPRQAENDLGLEYKFVIA